MLVHQLIKRIGRTPRNFRTSTLNLNCSAVQSVQVSGFGLFSKKKTHWKMSDKMFNSKQIFEIWKFRPFNAIRTLIYCSLQNDLFQSKEVQIEVPWGHIAGKWYGRDNVRPILLLHGWLDNAGTFDTLIPLLPLDFSYLAIDLPGHGFSSHLPKACFYHTEDFVTILETIRLKYNWDRLSLIAHSMGATVSFIYASIFPEKVNLVCALDTLKIEYDGVDDISRRFLWQMRKLAELNQNSIEKPPEYSYEDVCQRTYEGLLKSVDFNRIHYLVERGSRPSECNPNKFFFTRDIRVKFMQKFSVEQNVSYEFIKRIQAPYLFIRSDDQVLSESDENILAAVDCFRQHNDEFEMFRVKGTHHFHLNQPELIAGKIGDFLVKHHNQ